MEGYRAEAYGEAMADVYDEWYAGVSDVDATVAALTRLVAAAGGGRVLELGVGTGRLALPLAARGLAGHRGRRLAGDDRPPHRPSRAATRIDVVVGDMADDLPEGPFSLVFVAFNTFFGLTSREAQARCFAEVAGRLEPHGVFVLEAFVPDDEIIGGGARIEVRSLSADRVVLDGEPPRRGRPSGPRASSSS